MIPVMIVEDEFLVRIGLKSIIEWEKYGFSVVADASNGQTGLELFKKFRPYLVITDIRMSPMSGLEMMKEIRAIDDKVKFIVISAYSEFEYAKEAIKYGVELYLNKASFSIDEIVEVLKKVAHSYKESIDKDLHNTQPDKKILIPDLFHIIHGQNNNESLNSIMLETGLADCEKVVVACRFDRSQNLIHNNSLIINIFEEILEHEKLKYGLYSYNQYWVLILDNTGSEKVYNCIRHMSETLRKYTKSRIYFGISPSFNDPNQLFHSINKACQSCNDFIFDKSVFVRKYSHENTLGFNEHSVAVACEEIKSLLFSKKPENIYKLLHELVFSAKCYRSLVRIIFTIIASFENFDHIVDANELLNSIMSRDDLEDICHEIYNWITQLSVVKLQQKDSYVEKVIEYIKEHLSENLSLKNLADKFHLSPNYLGKIFYKSTGIYLNEYVLNMRINKACELILNTDYSMYEIGLMVGIDNQNYFSKLFKKKMGVSPQKYKNMSCCNKNTNST